MRIFTFSLALFIASTSSTWADTRAHEKAELARYQQFAGAPIDEFRMVDLFRTQVVGPENVVIWSTIKDAYLVKVDKPCRSASSTSSTSVNVVASSRFAR